MDAARELAAFFLLPTQRGPDGPAEKVTATFRNVEQVQARGIAPSMIFFGG